MNYATWKLNFTDPKYGTGPEETIKALGSDAYGAWVDGETILGYLESPQDEIELQAWSFQNISSDDALDFCLAINENAYLLEDGRITSPIEALDF
jgi:hypothetical protein